MNGDIPCWVVLRHIHNNFPSQAQLISQRITSFCNMFRMLVYAYKFRSAFVLAFLDTAVGKTRGLTPHLFRGSYSHAHWITSGAAAIHIMDLNSFPRCTQLNAPCTGLWHGDLQERMRRCFGLFLSTAVMTHRTPSPM